MTDLQKKFVEIAGRIETLKEEMKALYPTLEEIMLEMGEGSMFQDPSSKLVYKIEKPKGTFVSFPQVTYSRTKKVGETKGSLAKKEAEAAGFKL